MEDAPTPGTALVLVRPKGTKTRDWPPAQRCGADRTDGTGRCGRWAVRGGDRCPMHGANIPAVQKSYADRVLAARLGVAGLVDPAVDALERALASKDEAVALRAAQVVLERLAPKGATVALHLSGEAPARAASEVVRERLKAVGAAMAAHSEMVVQASAVETVEQAVEAELVDDGWS